MRDVVRRAIEAVDRAEWKAEDADAKRQRRVRRQITSPGSFAAFEDLTRRLVNTPKIAITTDDSPVQITVPADSALAEIFQ